MGKNEWEKYFQNQCLWKSALGTVALYNIYVKTTRHEKCTRPSRKKAKAIFNMHCRDIFYEYLVWYTARTLKCQFLLV